MGTAWSYLAAAWVLDPEALQGVMGKDVAPKQDMGDMGTTDPWAPRNDTILAPETVQESHWTPPFLQETEELSM